MTDATVGRIQAMMPSLIVAGLSFYFMAVFGLAGINGLVALQSKFPDESTTVIGSALINAFNLAPYHLTTIWATLDAAKIAIAGFFLLAATEEPPEDPREPSDNDALDLGLHGAVALTLLLLTVSWNGGATAPVAMHCINLMLLFVTAGVSLFERGHTKRATTRLERLDHTEDFLASSEPLLPIGKAPLA